MIGSYKSQRSWIEFQRDGMIFLLPPVSFDEVNENDWNAGWDDGGMMVHCSTG
jgi:hypothetical protein